MEEGSKGFRNDRMFSIAGTFTKFCLLCCDNTSLFVDTCLGSTLMHSQCSSGTQAFEAGFFIEGSTRLKDLST